MHNNILAKCFNRFNRNLLKANKIFYQNNFIKLSGSKYYVNYNAKIANMLLISHKNYLFILFLIKHHCENIMLKKYKDINAKNVQKQNS